MEALTPIRITTCHVEPTQERFEHTNFYHVSVRDCPPYVPNNAHPLSWVREEPIQRFSDESVEWPPHPRSSSGDLLGAVVLIRSADNHYLFVRNGSLWGLPKGARHYREFTRLSSEVHRDPTVVFNFICLREDEGGIRNAQREVLEETGFELKREQLIEENQRNKHAYVRYVAHVPVRSDEYYEQVLRPQQDAGLVDHENDEIRWWSEEEVRTMLREPVHRRNMNYISYSFLRVHFT